MNSISQEFYETCALHNQIMYFVPWFITTYLPLYIKVIERTYKDGSGNLTKVIYPAQSSFVLPNNTCITFLAFQKFIEENIASVSISEINKPITQNNYLSLYVVATHVQRPPEIQDFKVGSVNNLEELIDQKLSGLKFKPIDLSQDFADKMEAAGDFKNQKNSGYATKPSMNNYYYPRPTPQDVLIEERDWNQTNTSYSGFKIYE
ncbi:hypothetical protein H5410_036387 [Solanum commersonii]|uniref:DUF7588 domain-containing protein n=1 Tax=Solanum commersonii TaxID=4109 RepID=A0A9J5Y3E3_SOLCO|nr:hypothetical protein H5410_036387 [Solanum commersonii]